MRKILLFDGKIELDTDWDYQTVFEQLKKQNCSVGITGGRWMLLYGIIEKSFLFGSRTKWDDYGYEVFFYKREPSSKIKYIKKYWRTDYEEIHGLKSDELIWSDIILEPPQ